MGFWRDFWLGPVDESPQVRSGDPATPPSDPSSALVIPPRESAANAVSSGQALSLIAVYRAAQVISTSVMQLSLDAYRDDAIIEPRPLLLRQPDFDLSRPAFLEQTTLSLVLNGNAFWRIYRDNQGRVTGLRVLNPRDVEIKTSDDGRVIAYQHGGSDLTTKQVQHLSLMRVPGDPRGRGPIQAAQAELRGALDTRDYAAHWFTEAGVPTGLLTSDQPLSAESASAAKERWTETQGGYRGVAVLGGGFRYQPVYLSPEDAQFIEGQQFNTTAISRLFGIPAHMMLAAIEGTSMTYSNMSQADAQYVKHTLTRYTVEIETAFSSIMPRGQEVKFNLEALLRPDVVTRYTMHQRALKAGFMSINEVRDIENLPPAPGGGFKAAQEASGPDPDVEESDDEDVQ